MISVFTLPSSGPLNISYTPIAIGPGRMKGGSPRSEAGQSWEQSSVLGFQTPGRKLTLHPSQENAPMLPSASLQSQLPIPTLSTFHSMGTHTKKIPPTATGKYIQSRACFSCSLMSYREWSGGRGLGMLPPLISGHSPASPFQLLGERQDAAGRGGQEGVRAGGGGGH